MAEPRLPDVERTALYRLFDQDGALLYVGITADVATRWSQHSRDKAWWPKVAERKVEWFESRDGAASAEALAIRIERPLYNHVHSPSKLLASFARAPGWRLIGTNPPAFRQMASDLRRLILDGEAGPGDRLPTTNELASYYGVSTVTVQNALLLLKREGLAVGRPGSAVYAALPAQVQTDQAHRLGSGAGNITLIGDAMTSPSRRILSAMELSDGAKVRERKWLRHLQGVPVEYVRAYGYETDQIPAKSVDRVTARVPTDEVVSALDLHRDSPILVVLRTEYGLDEACLGVQLISTNGDFTSVAYNF